MRALADRVLSRILPALVTALGVMVIAAGLLQYTQPVEAEPGSSAGPAVTTPGPSPSTSDAVAPSAAPSAAASPSPSGGPADRVATRLVVPALGIDLPIARQPNPSYPACNIAMYLEDPRLGQPGQGRAMYLYAHARVGMFLPILDASKVNNGAKMIGMIVQVYTSDDQLFLYEITEVRRHQTSLEDALNATTEELWLQTSEGPRAAPGVITPKTQVLAVPFSQGPADPAEAHPVPKPVACG
jgi:hypothetical protein